MKNYLKKIHKIIYFLLIFCFFLFKTIKIKAVCPLCAVGIGIGLGLSRWLKVDDLISGIWIGGFLMSLSLWTINWLKNKNIKFKFRNFFIILLFYFLTIFPLYYYQIIGHPLNKFLGIDKLLFGIIVGTFIFLFGVWFHNFLKKKNQGKSFFPFQKVFIPILFLIISSLIFFIIIY